MKELLNFVEKSHDDGYGTLYHQYRKKDMNKLLDEIKITDITLYRSVTIVLEGEYPDGKNMWQVEIEKELLKNFIDIEKRNITTKHTNNNEVDEFDEIILTTNITDDYLYYLIENCNYLKPNDVPVEYGELYWALIDYEDYEEIIDE